MSLNYAALAALAQAQAGIRRSEVVGLPKGWIREEIPKFAYGSSTGLKGGIEVVYYTPKGQTIRTKNEMAKALGDGYDLTAFNFQTGEIDHQMLHSIMQKAAQRAAAQEEAKLAALAQQQTRSYHQSGNVSHHSSGSYQHNHNSNQGRKGSTHHRQSSSSHHQNSSSVPTVNGRSTSHGNSSKAAAAAAAANATAAAAAAAAVPASPTTDASLVPPIRQTASIFKQPVTLYKKSTHVDEAPTAKKRPSDLKATSLDTPRQLFWEKRLAGGLRAYCPDEIYEPWKLPEQLKPTVPQMNDPGHKNECAQVVIASLSTSLHLNGSAKANTGSSSNKHAIASMREKDPSVFCQPDQPLIAATKVSQAEVDKQEARVIATRKRLAEALAALEG